MCLARPKAVSGHPQAESLLEKKTGFGDDQPKQTVLFNLSLENQFSVMCAKKNPPQAQI